MSEQFIINYYYMGQGDCILIVCPNGQLVMIDCGSAKGLGGDNKDMLHKVYKDVRKFTTKNKNKIDILILTHRDKDHYNQVQQIFSGGILTEDGELPQIFGKINIDTVYYSSPPPGAAATVALYKFKQGSCNHLITQKTFQTKSINQVFINAGEQRMMTYTSENDFRLADGTETLFEKKQVQLLPDKTSKKKAKIAWSVSLIAGQVEETKSKAGTDITNALSLVTLLRIGTAKGLFLGDATKATEAFLLKHQKSLIKNVDFVHISHHGSQTSSGEDFVKIVNPKGAEVSHETYESGFKLPKGEVIQRWLKALDQKGDADNHMIDYWEVINKAIFDKILKSWKTNPNVIPDKDSGYYLSKIPKGYGDKYIYIHQKNGNYWGLYRKKTDQNLWGTGADDGPPWKLPF